MSGHTPGPWWRDMEFTVGDDMLGGFISAANPLNNEHANVCMVYLDGCALEDSAEANARLIAAAPELLEAAQAILRGNPREFPDKWDALRAAVEKATGDE